VKNYFCKSRENVSELQSCGCSKLISPDGRENPMLFSIDWNDSWISSKKKEELFFIKEDIVFCYWVVCIRIYGAIISYNRI
jgi:hypothetical protein